MHFKYLFFISFGAALFIGCQEDSTLFDIMPHEDEEALDGMHDAYEMAFFYDDSLAHCLDGMHCTTGMIEELDFMFHFYDDLYTDYHNAYSHNNVGDDHHHSAGSPHHHGHHHSGPPEVGHHEEEEHGGEHGGEHHEEEHEEEEHEDHGSFMHNLETHLMMLELREQHEQHHPE